MNKPAWWIDGFFIYVVESPSEDELYSNGGEADMIAGIAKLLDVECIIKRVISKQMLFKALHEVAAERTKRPNKGVMMHVSAHGNQKEIGLANGDTISWHELAMGFQQANAAALGTLILCMSSCEGLFAETMAELSGSPPYALLAGCRSTPTWSQAALAFAAFYQRLIAGQSIRDAAAAMNHASGRDDFGVFDPQSGERA